MKTTFAALLLLASSTVQACGPLDLLGDAAGPTLNLSYDATKKKLKIESTQTSTLSSWGVQWGTASTDELLVITGATTNVGSTKNSVAIATDAFYTD